MMVNPFTAACPTPLRQHDTILSSLNRETFPECLEISAWTEEGEIMGVRHPGHQVEGVQFHPESILTASGDLLIWNFIRLSRERLKHQ